MAGSRLCATCQDILLVHPREDEEAEAHTDKQHHTDSEGFFRAIEQGCYICSWTWRGMRWSRPKGHIAHVPVHHTMYKWVRETDRLDQSDQNILQLWISGHETEKTTRRPDYYEVFWVLETSFVDQSQNIVRTTLNPSLRSEDTFSLTRTWIKECCSNHLGCSVPTDRRTLPTRLINVKTSGDKSKLMANVCQGNTLPLDTPYLALSHCWGSNAFLTMTRANASTFEISLPVKELSRTFQDALFATVTMGFQYIWIDCLCIIQDDLEDWKHEAQLMHDVYRNCTCMVSASSFADGREGFILHKRRIDLTPLLIESSSQSAMGNRSPLQDGSLGSYYLLKSHPWNEFTRGPIFLRGWTLQEQLLAPRAVHFGDDQAYWVCKQTIANEVWPRGWMGTPLEALFKHTIGRTLQFKLGSVLSDSTMQYPAWSEIVTNFSIRRLTFASDRLPALAGITNEFANQLKDESIHGLWLKDLYRGIMFEQLGGYGFSPPSSVVVPTWDDSPSWSWVALHKPVVWDSRLYTLEIFTVCSIDLLRSPRKSSLRLCGMLMKCPSDYGRLHIRGLTTTESDIRDSDDSDLLLHVVPDQWFNVHLKEHFQWQAEKEIDAPHAILRRKWLDCLVIMPVLYFFEQSRKNRTSMCLLLQEQPAIGVGVYRRVGTVVMIINCKDETALEGIKDQIAGFQRPLEHRLYQETDGNGNYAITVM